MGDRRAEGESLERKRTHLEYGRTMIEILAVLGIVALISIAGIAGYRSMVSRYRANQIISELGSRAAVGASQLRMGQELNDGEFGATTGAGYPARFELGPDDRGFDIVLSGVPADVCARLVDMDWNAPLAVYVGTDDAEVLSGERTEAETAECADRTDADGLVSMAFLFEGNRSGNAITYVRCADSLDCSASDCCFRGACVPRAGGACDADSDDDTPPVESECPAGTQKVGSLCVRVDCPSGQEFVGTQCVDCPAERPVWSAGKCYASGGGECPAGQRKVDGVCCAAQYDEVQKKWVCCAGDLVNAHTGTPGKICCPTGYGAVNGACCESAAKLAAPIYGTNQYICCASGAAVKTEGVATCCPVGQQAARAWGSNEYICCPDGAISEGGVARCCPEGESATIPNAAGASSFMCCPNGHNAAGGVCCLANNPIAVSDPARPQKTCCPTGSGGAANGTCCSAGEHGVWDAKTNAWQCCPSASNSSAAGLCCPSGTQAAAKDGEARCCRTGETLRNVDGEYLCCSWSGSEWRCNSCATNPLVDFYGNCWPCDAPESVNVSQDPNICLTCASQRKLFRHDGAWWCGVRSCPSDKPLQDVSGNCFSCADPNPVETNNCAVCPDRVMQDGLCKPACPAGQFWSTYGACYSCDDPVGVPASAAQCALCPQRERQGYEGMCVLTTCPENKPLRDLGGSRHESGTYTT